MARMLTTDELTALLSQHTHSYDSDCHEDYGCRCNAPEARKTDPSHWWEMPTPFERHLAAVIAAAQEAAE